jgi:hypothetical protein
MSIKPDLNKLKAEIATRKNEKTSTIDGVTPRDKFLYGLIESIQTGRETQSTALVKTVDNTVAAKKKETGRLQVNETVAPVQQVPQRPAQIQPVDMSPERDEQLWAEMEKRKKQTLAESLQTYISAPHAGAPMGQQPMQYNVGQPMQPMQLNEQYLTENVKKIVNNYLVENFGPIVEEAIKSTILEMYAVDRIKEVLTENKEMVQKIVYDTIRELQAKSKANKAQ